MASRVIAKEIRTPSNIEDADALEVLRVRRRQSGGVLDFQGCGTEGKDGQDLRKIWHRYRRVAKKIFEPRITAPGLLLVVTQNDY